jgi:excisionase family DNA binding protein
MNPFDHIDGDFVEIKALLYRIVGYMEQQPVGPKEDEIGGMALAERVTGLTKSSIYHLTHEQKIPCSKKGKRLYFKKTDLESWLTENPLPVRRELRQIPIMYPRRKRGVI